MGREAILRRGQLVNIAETDVFLGFRWGQNWEQSVCLSAVKKTSNWICYICKNIFLPREKKKGLQKKSPVFSISQGCIFCKNEMGSKRPNSRNYESTFVHWECCLFLWTEGRDDDPFYWQNVCAPFWFDTKLFFFFFEKTAFIAEIAVCQNWSEKQRRLNWEPNPNAAGCISLKTPNCR